MNNFDPIAFLAAVVINPALNERSLVAAQRLAAASASDRRSIFDYYFDDKVHRLDSLDRQVIKAAMEFASIQSRADVSSVFALPVSISAEQIQSLDTTPVVIVPAPGLGETAMLQRVLLRFSAGNIPFTGGGPLSISYAGGARATNTLDAIAITGASRDHVLQGIDCTPTPNAALQLTNDSGAFAAGNGSLLVYSWFSLFL